MTVGLPAYRPVLSEHLSSPPSIRTGVYTVVCMTGGGASLPFVPFSSMCTIRLKSQAGLGDMGGGFRDPPSAIV